MGRGSNRGSLAKLAEVLAYGTPQSSQGVSPARNPCKIKELSEAVFWIPFRLINYTGMHANSLFPWKA